MFDLLELIWKVLSQIIIGVRIIRVFELMEQLRYYILVHIRSYGMVFHIKNDDV